MKCRGYDSELVRLGLRHRPRASLGFFQDREWAKYDFRMNPQCVNPGYCTQSGRSLNDKAKRVYWGAYYWLDYQTGEPRPSGKCILGLLVLKKRVVRGKLQWK